MTIGERIASIMKMKKITQKELAKKLGIAQSTISTWKSGEKQPSSILLKDIAKILDVPVYYLLTGTKEPGQEILSTDEQEVITYYRDSSQEGKDRIKEHAEFIQSKYPAFPGSRKNETA